MSYTTKVVQVTNVSPSTTSEQMRTLFGFLGTIEELKLFPPDDSPMPVTSRVCFVKFQEPESVGVSQHLTNTVFVDRALIVVPFAEGLSGCFSLVWMVLFIWVAWVLNSEPGKKKDWLDIIHGFVDCLSHFTSVFTWTNTWTVVSNSYFSDHASNEDLFLQWAAYQNMHYTSGGKQSWAVAS